jgi:hypothetical protein
MFVPLLAVFAATATTASLRVSRRAAAGGLLAGALVTTALGLVALRATRGQYAAIEAAVAAEGAPLAMTPVRAVPQGMWRTDQRWFVIGSAQVDEALDIAEDGGISDVLVLWPDGLPFEAPGWTVADHGVVAEESFDLRVLRLARG